MKFGESFLQGSEALRVDQAQQAQLEVKAGIRLAPEIVVGRQENIEKPRKIFFAELRGLLREARLLVLGCRYKVRISAADPHHEQVTEVPDGLAAEVLKILPIGNQAMNQSESTLGRLR